jgi:hypothetical protein
LPRQKNESVGPTERLASSGENTQFTKVNSLIEAFGDPGALERGQIKPASCEDGLEAGSKAPARRARFVIEEPASEPVDIR